MNITVEQVADKIRELGTKRPDNKYSGVGGCYYNRGKCTDGSIGCIVGQALVELGFNNSDLYVHGIVYCLFSELGIQDKNHLYEWCRRVQTSQDTGDSWGQAIQYADKGIKKYHPLSQETGGV